MTGNSHPPVLRHLLRTRLRESPLFTGVDEAFLDRVIDSGRQEYLAANAEWNDERPEQFFTVLIQGRMEVVRIDPRSARRFTLFLLGPGDGYDILPLLDGQPHEATLFAIDDVHLLRFPLAQVRQWLRDNPTLNHNFLMYVGHSLRRMEDLATDLALHGTLKRLANLLLRHLDLHPAHGPPAEPVPVRLINDLKHERLASMIGSVRQIVNRHLGKLKRMGVIEQQENRLFVRDLETLKRYAERVEDDIERDRQRHDPHR